MVSLAACGNEVRFPGEDPDADDPCASRDEDECGSEACRPLYVGNTCEGDADYEGCVSRERVGCTTADDCTSGARCTLLELGVCAGPPEAITCLACGGAETGVCTR